MPTFRFNGTDAAGKYRTGERPGEGREEVAALLEAEGFAVDSLAEVEEVDEAARRDLSRREVAEMIEQLSALTRSGLPLPSGLRAAADELSSSSLRATFRDLAARIEKGEALDEALVAGSGRFPAHVRGLVLAGARSGRLADVLGEYVREANIGSEVRRKFWATLAYPLLTLAVVVALVIFICHLSVVSVDSLMDDFAGWGTGGRGRANTRHVEFLVMMSRLIDAQWPRVLLTIGAVAIVAWGIFRFALPPAERRRLACSVPIFGPVLRSSALAEFCNLLAMLIEAETPLPLALELAGDGVSDAALASSCRRMSQSVAAGNPLSTAVGLWPEIPAALGQLFRWSEERRALAGSLRVAGELFEARTRSQATYAGHFASTFLLLLILWWVGFAVASLYLPLVSAISRLSG